MLLVLYKHKIILILTRSMRWNVISTQILVADKIRLSVRAVSGRRNFILNCPKKNL